MLIIQHIPVLIEWHLDKTGWLTLKKKETGWSQCLWQLAHFWVSLWAEFVLESRNNLLSCDLVKQLCKLFLTVMPITSILCLMVEIYTRSWTKKQMAERKCGNCVQGYVETYKLLTFEQILSILQAACCVEKWMCQGFFVFHTTSH